MDAADAARGENGDARARGADHRRRHRRGTGPPGGEAGGQVRPAELGHAARLRQRLERRILEAHPDLARDHGNGGGHRTRGAHLGLDPARGLEVLGVGHPVGDNGRFQRHNRRPLRKGLGDLVGQAHGHRALLRRDPGLLLGPGHEGDLDRVGQRGGVGAEVGKLQGVGHEPGEILGADPSDAVEPLPEGHVRGARVREGRCESGMREASGTHEDLCEDPRRQLTRGLVGRAGSHAAPSSAPRGAAMAGRAGVSPPCAGRA